MISSLGKAAQPDKTSRRFQAGSKPATTHKELSAWSALRHHFELYLDRLVLPIGWIGTGTVGFAGNIALRDWNIMNTPVRAYVTGKLEIPRSSLVLYRQACQAPRKGAGRFAAAFAHGTYLYIDPTTTL